jgi:hypothetical protein
MLRTAFIASDAHSEQALGAISPVIFDIPQHVATLIAYCERQSYTSCQQIKADVIRLLTSSITSVGFEVFTANMNNSVFRDVEPCGFITNRRFGEIYRLHLQGRRNNPSEEKC